MQLKLSANMDRRGRHQENPVWDAFVHPAIKVVDRATSVGNVKQIIPDAAKSMAMPASSNYLIGVLLRRADLSLQKEMVSPPYRAPIPISMLLSS